MKVSLRVVAISVLLSLSAWASAETLAGTVKNGTTGKPAAGDEVVLLKLGQGMEEAGRTKTDAKGNFRFTLDDQGPHLVRAIHQGATYHSMAPPGSTSVEVEVYDVAKKVDGLSVTADVMRFQAQGNELQGIRLFAVDNQSKPPLTQLNDQNFEFYLPDGATVETGLAMTAGGKPITSAPVPQKEKNRYAFLFPLRPGTTQFQVVFHMTYSGELSVDPKPLYPAQHFVVVLPKTMQFSATGGAGFQSMQDPNQSDAAVQVASNTQVGQPLGFKISGTGVLAESSGDQGGGQQSAGGGGAQTSRPGGGLGPPIDAPDPLEKYQLYILGGFVVALVIGGVYIVRRSKSLPAPDYAASDVDLPAAPAPPPPSKTAPASRSGLLLEALKEEMFELELEHKQGRISQQEYEKAKAALDQTLSRAVKRETAKT
ncbi:MAG: DUF4198 domain-containing protein [Acidobacteriia bacterium]|nr:DUF4198 domain-containing protein [Terriglobia bacterium]